MRRIELLVAVAFGGEYPVVDLLHVGEEGDHLDVGVDPFQSAGVGGPAAGGGGESQGAFVGVDDAQSGWFANHPVPAFCLVEESGFLHYFAGPPRLNFFVGGDDDEEGRLQIASFEMGCRADGSGQRALHVAGTATVELALAHPAFERIGGPAVLAVGGHHVVVAHQGEAAFSLSQLGDDGEFVDAVVVHIGEFLHLKPDALQHIGDVPGDGDVAGQAFRSVGDEFLSEFDDIEFHGSGFRLDSGESLGSTGSRY